jgi:hypothetical protein
MCPNYLSLKQAQNYETEYYKQNHVLGDISKISPSYTQ